MQVKCSVYRNFWNIEELRIHLSSISSGGVGCLGLPFVIGKFFISNILSLSCLLLFRIIGAGGGLGFTLTGLVISTLSGFGSPLYPLYTPVR